MSKSKRRYCFTYNNPVEEITYDSAVMRFLIYQLEKGEKTRTPHFQGYVALEKKMTIKSLVNYFPKGIHFEECKGSEEDNIKYCTKKKGRIDGPWEYGERSKQGKRNDIIALRDAIMKGKKDFDIIKDNELVLPYAKYMKFAEKVKSVVAREESKKFRKVVTTILIGPAGTGKTRYIFDNFKHDDIYKLDRPDGPIWFDGYEGQKVLLLDDFYGWIKYSFLLNLLDGYTLRLNIKGGTTYALWEYVFITSNKHIEKWYVDKGRTPALDRRITSVIYSFPEVDG